LYTQKKIWGKVFVLVKKQDFYFELILKETRSKVVGGRKPASMTCNPMRATLTVGRPVT